MSSRVAGGARKGRSAGTRNRPAGLSAPSRGGKFPSPPVARSAGRVRSPGQQLRQLLHALDLLQQILPVGALDRMLRRRGLQLRLLVEQRSPQTGEPAGGRRPASIPRRTPWRTGSRWRWWRRSSPGSAAPSSKLRRELAGRPDPSPATWAGVSTSSAASRPSSARGWPDSKLCSKVSPPGACPTATDTPRRRRQGGDGPSPWDAPLSSSGWPPRRSGRSDRPRRRAGPASGTARRCRTHGSGPPARRRPVPPGSPRRPARCRGPQNHRWPSTADSRTAVCRAGAADGWIARAEASVPNAGFRERRSPHVLPRCVSSEAAMSTTIGWASCEPRLGGAAGRAARPAS